MGSAYSLSPSDESSLRVEVNIEWNHPLIGLQRAECVLPDSETYLREIAPARTFGFVEEIEALRAAGLAKGGSTENAIIVHRDSMVPPLRFPNELARHKLLDVIGDIALAGAQIPQAQMTVYKPSHRLNARLAALL